MIEFNSEGWFGVISREITFENMAIIAQAVADLLSDSNDARKIIALGYDTRFLSKEYAWEMQRILTGNCYEVKLARKPQPSPVFTSSVVDLKAELGIMITGDDRPARYSGVIFRDRAGKPVSQEWLERLFNNLYRRYPRYSEEDRMLLSFFSGFDSYSGIIKEYIDFDLIRQSAPTVVCDSFYGSVGKYFQQLLSRQGIKCISIRSKPNPCFEDMVPQVTNRNLGLLSRIVKERNADVGFFFNSNGNSVGIVDSKGNKVNYSNSSILIVKEWNDHIKKVNNVESGLMGPSKVQYMRFNNDINQTESEILLDDYSITFKDISMDNDGILQALVMLQILARKNLDWHVVKGLVNNEFNSYMDSKNISIRNDKWRYKQLQLLDGNFYRVDDVKEQIIDDESVKVIFYNDDVLAMKYNVQEEILKLSYEGIKDVCVEKVLSELVKWLCSEKV